MTDRALRRLRAPLLTCLFLLTGAACASAQTGDYSGLWDTTYGLLTVVQDGTHVTGTYSYGNGSTITGTVEGDRLDFRYQEPEVAGVGWFDLTEEGGAFEGQWQADGDEAWYPWNGQRSARAAAIADNTGFSGLFDSTYGRLRLARVGDHVTGSYSHAGGSTVAGTVEGARLVFRYAEPDAVGEGWFELSEDGQAMQGAWRAEGAPSWGEWTATRVHAQPGRVWLVVLEAPWEESLAEPEYAFGDMLRSYFERLPNVSVRHRRMYDVADFERSVRDLAYLAEPVALLIASHGLEGQLIVGGERLTAEHFERGLAAAPNVFLLHFSSCDTMTHGMPEAISAALSDRPLAISGYTTFVDWSASALIEFLYLDLVLGRGLAPSQAAEVVRREVHFAGDVADPMSPLGAAGFRFVE